MTIVETDSANAGERLRDAWLAFAGIVLVAANLRLAVSSLGPVLDEVRGGLRLSGSVAGVVTTLPLICFAVFGALTPRLASRYGVHRVLVVAGIALALGLVTRAVCSSAVVFVVASTLALVGLALQNVLLPVLVKRHFPGHIGIVTGCYATVMVAGASFAAAITVPITHAWGGWRMGLGIWALAVPLQLLPWLRLAWADRPMHSAAHKAVHSAAHTQPNPIRPARTRLGWVFAIYFGTQGIHTYVVLSWLPQWFRDSGFSAETAGALVAVAVILGIPMALAMPVIAERCTDQRGFVLAFAACYCAGYIILGLAPRAGAWPATILLGLGGGTFPLLLTMLGLRARTTAGTAALSGFVQSTGYLIAALGMLVVGLLHDTTLRWQEVVIFLMATVMLQTGAGLSAGRPQYLEDERKEPRGYADAR